MKEETLSAKSELRMLGGFSPAEEVLAEKKLGVEVSGTGTVVEGRPCLLMESQDQELDGMAAEALLGSAGGNGSGLDAEVKKAPGAAAGFGLLSGFRDARKSGTLCLSPLLLGGGTTTGSR